MTLKQLARKYFRSTNDIEDLLKMLRPGKKTIIRTYKLDGHKVKVYKPGYALNAHITQIIGQSRPLY